MQNSLKYITKEIVILIIIICSFKASAQVYEINDGLAIKQGKLFTVKISQIREYDKKLIDQEIHRIKILAPDGVDIIGNDMVNVRNSNEAVFNLRYNENNLPINNLEITIRTYGYSQLNHIASIIWRSSLKYPIALSWSIISFITIIESAEFSDKIIESNKACWTITRPHKLRRTDTRYSLENFKQT